MILKLFASLVLALAPLVSQGSCESDEKSVLDYLGSISKSNNTYINADPPSDVYINENSIRKTNDGYKAWVLKDFESSPPPGYKKPYLSLKSLIEFDCDGKQHRIHSLVYYSEHMGCGEAVKSEEIPISIQWEPIPTGSVLQSIMKRVCKTTQ